MRIEIQDINESTDMGALIAHMDEAFRRSGLGGVECTYTQPVTGRTTTRLRDESRREGSAPKRAADIIRDLQQHNYGDAEQRARALLQQLQDQHKARMRPAEVRPLPPAQRDCFERQIEEFITNLEEPRPERQHNEYHHGMVNAYRYALAVYRRQV